MSTSRFRFVIALQAAEGKTNRQIGTALYLSPKTLAASSPGGDRMDHSPYPEVPQFCFNVVHMRVHRVPPLERS
jgi:hypothetical protein